MKQCLSKPDVFVTEDGRVFRELIPSVDDAGYHQIRNGELRERRHVLVCEAFHGPRPEGREVRHLDGNPGNDAPDNLAWGTHVQNMQDAVKHGTHYTGSKTTLVQREEIRQRRAAGESLKGIAADYGISPQRVCDFAKGRA